MDSSINYIPFERFQDIVLRSGLHFEELAGFVKVSGAKGRKVYIPRTQRVGRVDISGFEYPGPGVNDLGDEAFGGVKQQLDFTLPEDQVLDNFVSVLEHMTKLPPVEARARAPRGTDGEEGQTGRTRRGRPSMTVPPPEGPSVQERRARQAQPAPAARPTRSRRGTQPRAGR